MTDHVDDKDLYMPNKNLTDSEKKAKRALKKQLKQQRKRVKLETRLRHAISRKDPRVEQETREALEKMLQNKANESSAKEEGSVLEEKQHKGNDDENAACRSMVAFIYQELQKMQTNNNQEEKEEQHRHAVALLKHMTKGTQDRSMFDNEQALWGYTRQKFFERAMLVCTSFCKLKVQNSPGPNVSNEDLAKRALAWEKVQSVKTICSIACGPGNDAVGMVAFLRSLQRLQDVDSDSPCLDRVLLMDWAMTEWEVIVKPLSSILVPKHVAQVESCSCDVTKPMLQSAENSKAFELLTTKNDSKTNNNNSDVACNVDLFLFSYIFSEQRGLWESFMTDLVNLAKPQALFYFAEPTPWQLHMLGKAPFAEQLDFIWLDSSMDYPLLQPLDNRVGPGVLLAIKRE